MTSKHGVKHQVLMGKVLHLLVRVMVRFLGLKIDGWVDQDPGLEQGVEKK